MSYRDAPKIHREEGPRKIEGRSRNPVWRAKKGAWSGELLCHRFTGPRSLLLAQNEGGGTGTENMLLGKDRRRDKYASSHPTGRPEHGPGEGVPSIDTHLEGADFKRSPGGETPPEDFVTRLLHHEARSHRIRRRTDGNKGAGG